MENKNITLKEIIKFALDHCEHEDCAGDYSVGLPKCRFWNEFDTDENNNPIPAHCILENLEKEEKNYEIC